jgi:hypothetical protein
MTSVDWLALSIRQPWVDLILSGDKTIEVREWPTLHRGAFLIHSSRAIDWRSMEFFGYDSGVELPRGGIVGYGRVQDVLTLTPSVWDETIDRHMSIHARRPIQYGLVLEDVRPFQSLVPCLGKRRFFPIPASISSDLRRQLELVDVPYDQQE